MLHAPRLRGGIRSCQTAERIFQIGFEKVVLNTHPFEDTAIITDLARAFGSQSVIAAIDVKKNLFGTYQVYARSGTENRKHHPVAWARELESRGAGEIFLTSIDREGTWKGFDGELTAQVASAVSIPVIAHGGAGAVSHIGDVVKRGRASAVALGSLVVYQGKDLGVLVNFPDSEELEAALC